ncbi:prepilin-type N-terminal cleavage/methylation domain-containing protein [Neiella sp. HB171785]|uniref:Prepilin-type N-terminal cleavage/methylation domain-containing protein n=1 Tax=Neiella litorisoli TaxID=2771431 RepID=A0A8J6QKB6_9GAMM|nr:prepilin-type N-terminal cleavage/methylation domain-containing protein [Neiella litorisoli]MBD1389801.1 prepilin-type N-terminal cleavage/methylation domain-containing protein [Neiella litorisoli]
MLFSMTNTHLYKSVVKGFTLMEMLVVLVILGLTTTLLSGALNTTWKSFERLSSRDLTVSAGMLGLKWFRQSVKGATLYHPEESFFSGNAVRIEFISQNVPNNPQGTPIGISWFFEPAPIGGWQLYYQTEQLTQPIVVAHFEFQPEFSYFSGGQWHRQYNPTNGSLPKAIQIKEGQKQLLAVIGRPEKADVPPELARFGVYEF